MSAPDNRVLTPKEFIADINAHLPFLSEKELTRLKEHARAWAVVAYEGDVPDDVEESLKELENQHAVI